MKLRTVGILSASLFSILLTTITTFNTGCGNTPASPAATATPTPSGFTLSGTVNYQGSGSNKIYVITAVGSAVPVNISSPITNGGTYSMSGNSQATELFVIYDNTGNGLQLSTHSGGTNVVQGNGASLSGSGDVACVVGYTGSCPNTGGLNGTFYSSSATVNLVFGGTTGQSGTSCTQ
jgi:hypothetical protein